MSSAQTQTVTEETYRRLALADKQGQLELFGGVLREKPAVSGVHGDVMIHFVEMLLMQLSRRDYRLRATHARLRASATAYYVPDVAVIPTAMERLLHDRPNTLDAFADPLPLVVEIWSPSTGDCDIRAKLPGYQQRGDLGIWSIQPYQRTLTVRRKLPNGGYAESVYHGGTVAVASLPGVVVDLDALLDPDS